MKIPAIATMDFGGTNGDMNLIVDYKPILEPGIHFGVNINDLDDIVQNIVGGFQKVISKGTEMGYEVKALSFAFPGPADFKKGVIGQLNNVPAFKKAGSFDLGGLLSRELGLRVFMNNDGDLDAEGERVKGVVEDLRRDPNRKWDITGCIAFTLGSGLGCGASTDKYGMFLGESSTGLEFGVNPIIFDGKEVRLEYAVSRYGLVRMYNRNFIHAKNHIDLKDPNGTLIIENYARGKDGDSLKQELGKKAYEEFGLYLGKAMVWASNMLDCPVIVLGGGLSKAHDLFLDTAMQYMKGDISGETSGDQRVKRLMKTAYNLENPSEKAEFLMTGNVFGNKKVGVALTKMGTVNAIYAGAYEFAMNELRNL